MSGGDVLVADGEGLAHRARALDHGDVCLGETWFAACGSPPDSQPVFPAHDGDVWDPDDWRNWRRRVWQGDSGLTPDPATAMGPYIGRAPAGTRPRDLRSSFVTLRVYEGVPLTQIGREVGTSVRMIEQHYAGVIANWDGQRRSAEEQITEARQTVGREMDALTSEERSRDVQNPC